MTTKERAVRDIKRDLLRDAEHAERQAHDGPFYADITPASLLAYAKECRDLIARNDWTADEFIKGKIQ